MGLIKAGMGALGGTLADQWKEFFYCDALDKDVLMVKGQKRTSRRSSNHGEDNIITNGSGVAVADGQCMLIVEQGKVVEVCAEPGEYTFDSSTEPSVFTGNFGDSLAATFQTVAKRSTYGGDTGKDQRVYYINTKELGEILYGTATPIPFRVVVSEERGYKLSVNIRCNGSFTYRICDPLLFYTNVCSNVSTQYDASEIAPRLKSELMNALQPALATLSANKVQYYEIPTHTLEISDALNEQLSNIWRKKRGIEVFSFNINSLSIPGGAAEEDHRVGRKRHDHRPHHRCRPSGGWSDRCHEDCCWEHRRCYDRLYGHGHGNWCKRHERPEPVRHGAAARSTPAADFCRRQLEVQLRRGEQGQVLLRVRQTQACWYPQV